MQSLKSDAVPSSPFSDTAPLSIEQIAEDGFADAPTPFARIERTPSGPKLIVADVCVRWWISDIYDGEADAMAARVNEGIAQRLAQDRASFSPVAADPLGRA